MFDFGSLGGGEILLIGIVALIVIGPKELPGLIRNVGQFMSKIRQMAFEFRSQFDEAMREAEKASGKEELDKLNSQVASSGGFNPLDSLRKEIANAVDIAKGETPQPAPAPAAPAPAPAVEAAAPPPPAKPAA